MKMSKAEILDLLYNYYGFSRKREFADFLGISSATLTNWYNRNTFDYDVILEKCREVDLNKLFKEGVASPDNDRYQIGQKSGNNPSEELLSMLKEKDRQLLELSEKVGQMKEQIRQLEKERK